LILALGGAIAASMAKKGGASITFPASCRGAINPESFATFCDADDFF